VGEWEGRERRAGARVGGQSDAYHSSLDVHVDGPQAAQPGPAQDGRAQQLAAPRRVQGDGGGGGGGVQASDGGGPAARIEQVRCGRGPRRTERRGPPREGAQVAFRCTTKQHTLKGKRKAIPFHSS